MPAMLDDPTAPIIYRTSGQPPFPVPYGPLPASIVPRQVTLRDRSTIATLVPFSSPDQVPKTLTQYLCALLNREIEKGDTYPMIAQLPIESFGPYWFANFGAVMLLGEVHNVEHVWQMEKDGVDWSKQCLGSFYIKPNYPGRSSHVCNGGFLVSDVARNRGVGRLMGEGYLEWAPQLGYTYSVFNLVYDTNIASVRIWDSLGFKRIGRVPGCGNLKSADYPVDAIIFGRDLSIEAEDYLSDERFDKIRYYLKTGLYPNGADRAEKSRLRSAGAHYRLVSSEDAGEDKLMLKDKEVISDPHIQYDIAVKTHAATHAGINKTTAAIADRYHWIRIKETVSRAIRNCTNCKESARPKAIKTASTTNVVEGQASPGAKDQSPTPMHMEAPGTTQSHVSPPSSQSQLQTMSEREQQQQQQSTQPQQHPMPIADMGAYPYDPMPVDPQIMSDMTAYKNNEPDFSDHDHPAQQHLHQYQAAAAAAAVAAYPHHHHHQSVGDALTAHGYHVEEDGADAQLQAELAGQMRRERG